MYIFACIGWGGWGGWGVRGCAGVQGYAGVCGVTTLYMHCTCTAHTLYTHCRPGSREGSRWNPTRFHRGPENNLQIWDRSGLESTAAKWQFCSLVVASCVNPPRSVRPPVGATHRHACGEQRAEVRCVGAQPPRQQGDVDVHAGAERRRVAGRRPAAQRLGYAQVRRVAHL